METENRLDGSATAILVVHPWGLDDGHGLKTPEPAGVAFFCTLEKNEVCLRHVKEVMNLLGMHGGSVRPPLTQLTHEKMEELKRVLEVIGKSGALGPLSIKQRVSREK